MIGIIFAMKEELESFITLVKLDKKNRIFDIEFYECSYKGKKLILVESGVGKVNAARTCQLLIDNYMVDYVLNVGVAGGISEDVNMFDIVVGDKLVQHDFDLVIFGHEPGHVPKVGKYVEADRKLLKLFKKLDINVNIGTIASGDIFVTDKELAKSINERFNALCCEMEGASIAQVCFLSRVPFLVIRSISDSVVKAEDNVIDFEEFLDISCRKVSNVLIELIKEI